MLKIEFPLKFDEIQLNEEEARNRRITDFDFN